MAENSDVKQKDTVVLLRKVAKYIRTNHLMIGSQYKGLFYAFVENCIDELSGRVSPSDPIGGFLDSISSAQLTEIQEQASTHGNQVDKCRDFVNKVQSLLGDEDQKVSNIKRELNEIVLIRYMQNALGNDNRDEIKGVLSFIQPCDSALTQDIFKKRHNKRFNGQAQQYDPKILAELGVEFMGY